MGRVTEPQVSRDAELLREAYFAAETYARASVAEGDGFVSPKAQVGSLSAFEWQKLVHAAVSGWIIERVAQASREQIHHDNMIFVADGDVAYREVGKMAAVLPALGSFVESKGLSDKPIGEWARDDVLTFAWLALKNGDLTARHFDEMDNEIPF